MAATLDQTRRELNHLIDQALQQIAVLKTENAALKAQGLSDRADIFWDASETEISRGSEAEVIDDYPDGEIVEVQRAASLPSTYAVWIPTGDGDREIQIFDSEEEARAFVASARAA